MMAWRARLEAPQANKPQDNKDSFFLKKKPTNQEMKN
jgi:hypothetical protein